ncbi:MAG: sce7726 family protein [Clostridia bacterium]|nr:sce7726 family protein [Clostridia bacterium]
MKDKEIRKILIEYLKASGDEIRIYQEKTIGSSVCDVMAATGILTGYEIKSDSDNFVRLASQITSYSRYFDKNYIVCGKSNIRGASARVPEEWGILCVSENEITLVREAKENKCVDRRRQLSVLWKLELKNLLVKNNMPVYAQKEKGYIADRLAENVDSGLLGSQIAFELLHRDYSVYQADDYTIHSEGGKSSAAISNLPTAEIIDNLSEENLTQYTLDEWIAIYNKAKAVRERKTSIYQAQKPVLTPHEITYKDIEVSLGVPWIKPNLIDEFIRELLDMHYSLGYGALKFAEYEPITGNWNINNKRLGNDYPKAYSEYGTERYNALRIIEASLNLREIKVYDDCRLNEKETLAAIEKQEKINAEFKKWIWKDETRRWIVEEEYNKIFGKYKKKTYDGSRLEFPEMSADCTLYEYQKDAVQKIISEKNTLLAFDVGAGKTYIMIAAAMKMRQMGISRKNMFVVPNNIVGQWEKIFSELYPKARILAVEPKTFKPEMRQKVLKQIKTADYDGIIIAYSCFEMIPLSEKYIVNTMEKKTKELNEAIAELERGIYWKYGTTPLYRQRDYIRKLTDELLDAMYSAPADITFDQLEINTIFLDEAHNYKNLPLKTRLKDISGINTKGSRKCLEMLTKVRCVQDANNGRGAVFATGTPLCNSIADTFVMQTYLQNEELKKHNLDKFDNWVKTFAKPEQVCEIDVDTSKFRFVTRFARFFNLPELSRMFSDVAVFYAVDESDLPELEGYTDTVIKRNGPLEKYMKTLCERTESIRAKEVDKKQDNMLKVSTDGRKAALDLRLVGKEQAYDSCSKIFRCVENVIEIYNKYEGCAQIVFCDYSTPKSEKFDVYNETKARLIEAGIPGKEIAFIHSYKSESTKLKLFEDVNSGRVRVLLGSTFKLGIGANVQRRLKAVHHLDVPWRPADMVQREGRILRRGNENENILIYRYIAEGSFDSYSWQILETKQKFISQFLEGSAYQRSSTDLEDNVLTYAQVKALALAQPLMKKLAETENELRNLRKLREQEEDSRKHILASLPEREKALAEARTRMSAAEKLMKYSEKLKKDDYQKIKELLTPVITPGFIENPESSFVSEPFTLTVPVTQPEKDRYINLNCFGAYFPIKTSGSASGNATRVINFIKKSGEYYKEIRKTCESLSVKLAADKETAERAGKYDSRIRDLKMEYDELFRKINSDYEEE